MLVGIFLAREWLRDRRFKPGNGNLKIDLIPVRFILEIIPMTPKWAESLDSVVSRSDSLFGRILVSEYSFHPFIQRKKSKYCSKSRQNLGHIIPVICHLICINYLIKQTLYGIIVFVCSYIFRIRMSFRPCVHQSVFSRG